MPNELIEPVFFFPFFFIKKSFDETRIIFFFFCNFSLLKFCPGDLFESISNYDRSSIGRSGIYNFRILLTRANEFGLIREIERVLNLNKICLIAKPQV